VGLGRRDRLPTKTVAEALTAVIRAIVNSWLDEKPMIVVREFVLAGEGV